MGERKGCFSSGSKRLVCVCVGERGVGGKMGKKEVGTSFNSLDRKRRQLTPEAPTLLLSEWLESREGLQVNLDQELVLCFCSQRTAQEGGKPIRRIEVGK